jgi:hypothetical protein
VHLHYHKNHPLLSLVLLWHRPRAPPFHVLVLSTNLLHEKNSSIMSPFDRSAGSPNAYEIILGLASSTTKLNTSSLNVLFVKLIARDDLSVLCWLNCPLMVSDDSSVVPMLPKRQHLRPQLPVAGKCMMLLEPELWEYLHRDGRTEEYVAFCAYSLSSCYMSFYGIEKRYIKSNHKAK